MLRIYTSKNSAQAKSYFAKELSRGDYYFGKDDLPGIWGGKAAQILGLSGHTEQSVFNNLVDNIHPETGDTMTARHRINRRAGFDISFNTPKSFSILAEYSGDERLLEAFRDAVHSTMEELETEVYTRVRKDGSNEIRRTGNLVYSAFEHYTSRAVKGHVPDMNCHMHCFVPNLTFDEVEQQWKAAELINIRRDAPYYEARFHSHLSNRLTELDINIESDGKYWKIAGISKETVNKFSNRTKEIEEYIVANNIQDDKAKDQVGAQLRTAKVEGLSKHHLRDIWWNRLDDQEKETLDRLSAFKPDDTDAQTQQKQIEERMINADKYLDYALRLHLERQSVLPLSRLKESALREGFGDITAHDIDRAIAQRKDLIILPLKDRVMVSTLDVLREEEAITQFVVNGYATQQKYHDNYVIPKLVDHSRNTDIELSDEQKKVIQSLLASRHRVDGIQGKAGTGKTTLLAGLIEGIETSGNEAVILAPSADAAYNTLHQDGETYQNSAMQQAQTLARFIVNEREHEKHQDKTIIVDEAGLLSVGDMHKLFSIAQNYNNRIVLVGDSGQHNSVNRGDAFRILQQEAGLETYQLEQIRRQQGVFKQAVDYISKGNLEKGFNQLDELNAIHEETDAETRYKALSNQYVEHLKHDKTVLAVAPTHAEGAQVTQAIRDALQAEKLLSKKEQKATRFHNLQLTEAERGNIDSYHIGQMVRFQQNAKGGIVRGAQYTIANITDNDVIISDGGGETFALDLSLAPRFNLYEQRDIHLSPGEKIRITEGGTSKDGGRLNNGSIQTVKNVKKNGDIELLNGRTLDASQGNFNYGYVTTSHASQGKTVDHVLIAQNTEYDGAASQEQFYVSVSRGRQSVEIFTDDKTLLSEQIKSSHARVSVIELTKNQPDGSARWQKQIEDIQVMTHYANSGLFNDRSWSAYKHASNEIVQDRGLIKHNHKGLER